MNLDVFGKKIFDFSQPFSYFEAFSTIIIVVGISFFIFLYLSKKAKNLKQKEQNK
ncbi:hypothetical protein [Helicobacter didelphidarum]|uniref:hypothetical protein n=1 Tax=Helicobacter didelphidarum TaxID=2040648 RepID=UPI0015F1B18C|nr:hypothetical protein [Helicobacter didelphidarum]